MPRTSLLVPTSLLLSCAPAGLDSGAAAPPDAPEALPAGASPGWLETAKTRIAASARSIVPENGTFVAALPGHRAIARFTDEGLALGELDAAAPLELRFTSWGAAGAERAVEPVSPTLGACLTELLPGGDCARQLEYAHEGVTAWWVGLDRGVEFGWTVAAPPAEGGDELVFEVEVSGADWLAAAGEGAELVDASGETWTVSGALAWGADGAALPAWLEVEGDALVVRVEAGGAVYPVTVDPVLSAATTTLTGGAVSDSFGISVSGAGDVNGDGYDDVIIGAYRYSGGSLTDAGAAYIHHGSSSGVSSSASRTLTGVAAGDTLGYSVSGAGDVNGDGYDDVIIGASNHVSGSLTSAGAAYIHYGSSSGVSTSASRTLMGGAAYDYFGKVVSGAGDVNGDGYDDVIIGAPGYDSGSLTGVGVAYIHHGSSSGVSSSANRTLTGGAASEFFGTSVSGAGDVNGDGYDDVIIGAPYYKSGSLNFAGAATIHHGSSSGVSSIPSRTLTGGAAYDYFGVSVSGAGDVNRDGYDDVIIGASGYGSGSLSDAGAAYIHHGSSSGVSSSTSRILIGGAASDYCGWSVSGAGDVNSDGYDDVIIGAYGYNIGSLITVGAAYIHHGSSSGVSSSASRTLTGVAEYDQFGRSVAGAGDVNGDGQDDAIIGAFGSLSYAGAAFIHHGYADGDGDGVYLGGDSSTPQDCDDADASVGAPSSWYVDSDGDGFGSTATVTGCPGDAGTAATATDCDDARTDVHPGAAERCDAADTDEDCDGLSDDADPSADPSTFSTFYADTDADGFGDASAPTSICDPAAGQVIDSTDCDDANPAVNPGATEQCSGGTDEDCDGLADDADPSVDPAGFGAFYADEDGDGFGAAGSALGACVRPDGAVEDATDCDDARADVNPGAVELCDAANVDEDCDGLSDDEDPSVERETIRYNTEDRDSDGLPDPAALTPLCDGGDPVKGCSTAPASPLPWLGALLALPALLLRRRRGLAAGTAR
jgi:hypothetical protein